MGARHIALLLSLWLLAFDSSAHPNHGASWGERYLKVEVGPDTLRVVYGLTFTARYGGEVRRLSDRDGDGLVSAGEVDVFSDELAGRLSKNLELSVDEAVLDFDWGQPAVVNLAGKVTPGPLALESVASIPLERGASSVTLVDRAEFEGIYRTTATLNVAPEVKLLRSGRGKTPRGIKRRAVFLDLPSAGPPPARVLTLEFELPSNGGTSLVIALLAAGAIVALLLFFLLARRRGRKKAEA